jgi:hypothetical protein
MGSVCRDFPDLQSIRSCAGCTWLRSPAIDISFRRVANAVPSKHAIQMVGERYGAKCGPAFIRTGPFVGPAVARTRKCAPEAGSAWSCATCLSSAPGRALQDALHASEKKRARSSCWLRKKPLDPVQLPSVSLVAAPRVDSETSLTAHDAHSTSPPCQSVDCVTKRAQQAPERII